MSDTNKTLFTISCIITAISLFAAILTSYSISQYGELFQNFDANLPENTKNLIDYHYFGLVAPFLALLALIYLHKSKLDQTFKNIIYALAIITFIVTISWLSYADELMYSAIMQMETN